MGTLAGQRGLSNAQKWSWYVEVWFLTTQERMSLSLNCSRRPWHMVSIWQTFMKRLAAYGIKGASIMPGLITNAFYLPIFSNLRLSKLPDNRGKRQMIFCNIENDPLNSFNDKDSWTQDSRIVSVYTWSQKAGWDSHQTEQNRRGWNERHQSKSYLENHQRARNWAALKETNFAFVHLVSLHWSILSQTECKIHQRTNIEWGHCLMPIKHLDEMCIIYVEQFGGAI